MGEVMLQKGVGFVELDELYKMPPSTHYLVSI